MHVFSGWYFCNDNPWVCPCPGLMLTTAVLGTGLGGEAAVNKTRVVGGALLPVGGGQQESAQQPVEPKGRGEVSVRVRWY